MSREPSDLQVRSAREGPLGLLAVEGELRLEIAARLHVAGVALLEDGVSHLLLDLSRASFMDSASLGVLIRLDRAVAEAGGRFVLHSCPKAVARVLDHSGLADRFHTTADEASARAAVS